MPTISHPTLKGPEAALLDGEQPKEEPIWKSPNELIHEKVNFDDTIWGFGLAGGAHYRTPIRVTYVKPGSRAQMAHIFPGDIVLKINGIDSSTLTLKEAHKIILESGIHLVINVTAPEDEQEAYYCYEDPLAAEAAEEEKAKKAAEKPPRRPRPSSKCSFWGLQWPWKCRKKPIYKESNCYLVPSKFVEKHSDKLRPEVKSDDTIVLDSIYNVKKKTTGTGAEENSNNAQQNLNVKDNFEHGNEEIEPNGPVDNNKDGIANGGDVENDPNVDKISSGDVNVKEETKETAAEDNSNNVVNDNLELSNEEIEPNGPVDNNKDGIDNDGDSKNNPNLDEIANGDINDEGKTIGTAAEENSSNAVNDNIEHGNEEIESNSPVDNNKDGIANGGDEENNPNVDKSVNGDIPEESKSEEVITNG